MEENTSPKNPGSPEVVKVPRPRRLTLLMWMAACGLVVGASVFLLNWNRHPPVDIPLDGELNVSLIKVTNGKQVSYPVEDPNALPIGEGDGMHLEIRCNQPAFMYLVWLDSRGKVVPLYPWNMDNIEVTDANEAPPLCRASTLVLNPITIGNTWKFDKGSGLETVLLLARRTPMDANVKLQALLGDVPPAKLRDPGEVAVLGLNRGAPAISTFKAIKRGSVEEAHARDRLLATQLEKLRDQFDLIRVVRFAHEDK